MKTEADHKKNHDVIPIYKSLKKWEVNALDDCDKMRVCEIPSLSGSSALYTITLDGKMLIKPMPPDFIRIHIPRKYVRLRKNYAALDIKIREIARLLDFII